MGKSGQMDALISCECDSEGMISRGSSVKEQDQHDSFYNLTRRLQPTKTAAIFDRDG